MNIQARMNLSAANGFVKAVESMDGSCLDTFFSENVAQTEWPNLFKPQGEHRNLDQLKADIEKACGILREQSYEIVRELANEDCVILEMVWRGTMEVDLPPLRAGQALCAHCVAVFDFQDGKVVSLRNYDCFDPFQ
ncbi:nuclear transport factor 2 family protein [Roseibium sp. SCP14]|uniref:nuclear transport factor 2 family protein n=1 Tax=Roseibium sp. SCP14 TaxID=3141375 RepID=UPI0033352E36